MLLPSASHDTNVIINGCHAEGTTGTSTDNRSHVIPLYNHVYMTNAMASLMVPSGIMWQEMILLQHACKTLICPSKATYGPQMQISSCAWVNYVTIYCLIWTQCNHQHDQKHWYNYILHYCKACSGLWEKQTNKKKASIHPKKHSQNKKKHILTLHIHKK